MASRELIPGLPNELAMEVLLGLPAHSHLQAMEVSSLWRIVLCSDRFYVQRRLRFPSPSLILFFHGRSPPFDANTGYQLLDFDHGNLSSLLPRPIYSSRLPFAMELYPSQLGVDYCMSLDATSFLLVNGKMHDGWMQFNMLSRRWTRFGRPGPLPFDFQVEFVHLLGSLGSRAFLLASIDDGFSHLSHQVSLSYDFISHRWDTHHGLPEQFPSVTMHLTCQGKIFVRNNEDPPIVYCFDLSSNSWKEDAHMTQRLSMVPSWSRVVATHDGTLICLAQVTSGVLEVRQQEAGATNWCVLLEIATGLHNWVAFYLFIQDEHIYIVTEGPCDDTQDSKYHVGQRLLTCIFVPYSVLVGAVLM